MGSSSSDSDAGERVKNLQSILVKSETSRQEAGESYAYKRKSGDLIFNANFEGGNLGSVERIDRYDYDLMVRPDVANPRHRLWFNFKVSNQRPNQCIIFNFVNLSNQLQLFHHGLTPVVRSCLNPDWMRLHEDQVFYYQSENHGKRFVLSIAFRFSSAYDDEHQFALFYPYTHSQLSSFINRWQIELQRNALRRAAQKVSSLSNFHQHDEADPKSRWSPTESRAANSEQQHLRTKSPYGRADYWQNSEAKQLSCGVDANFRVQTLSTSILSKPIYHLWIRAQIDPPILRPSPTLKRANRVIVICRANGGNLDGASSWICQGLMDYMLSECLLARVARQHFELVVLPMLDPDSICAGNSRSDIMGQVNVGQDKIWLTSGRNVYGNFVECHQLIRSLCAESERIITIELRVNLNSIGAKIVGTKYEDSSRMERHLYLPRLLARFAADFYLENCEFLKRDSLLSSYSAFTLDDTMDLANDNGLRCKIDRYNLEVSPFAYYKRSLAGRSYEQYDQRRYLTLGKALVYCLLELFHPKDKPLPHFVADLLNRFHPDANDIDNLMLRCSDDHTG